MKMRKQFLFMTMITFLLSLTLFLGGCTTEITSEKQLKGKKIGTVKGSIYEELVYDVIEKPEVIVYDDTTELITALIKKEIDAFMYDEVVCNYYISSNSFVNYIILSNYKYESGYILSKTEKNEKLLYELNQFIYDKKIDGELLKLQTKWTSDDKEVKLARDFNALTGNKGTIKVAVPPNVAPMAYKDAGQLLGYDIDLIYEFALEKGYKVEFKMVSYEGIFKTIEDNEADIGIGNIFITDERKEKYYMTDSVFTSYASIGVYTDISKESKKTSYNKLSDLRYKTLGVLEGTIYDNIAIEHFDGCKVRYYSTQEDIYNALKKGQVEGIIFDEPLARYKINKEHDFKMIENLITYEEYGAIFNKDTEFANTIRNQFNEYLAEIRTTGEYEEIDSIWFGDDESLKHVDYENLPNINGRVRMCVTAEIGEPFAYLKDNKFVGYDVDMVYRFCKKYGYALSISNVSFTRIFDDVVNNEYDMSACCISITEDRKKLVNYSDTNYLGGLVCVVKK